MSWTASGSDAPWLQEADPALIYVSISAYGSHGPSSSRPGFDPILQAESGMMALTGEVDGGPMRHPLSIIDTLTAAHATSAICAALHGRQRHGRGDFIDLCLLDTAISALGNVGMQYLTDGQVPPRSGNRHVVGAPIDLFATATEPIYLAMATDRLFADFCRVIDRPDLADDERFATPAGRSRNRDALKVEIEAALATRPAAEWLAAMGHLPAGGVRTIDHALQSPEVLDREMVRYVVEDDHPLALLGTPFKFAATELAAFRSPPLLGQHTDEVLSDGAGDGRRRHRAAPPRRRDPLMAAAGAARHAAPGAKAVCRCGQPTGWRAPMTVVTGPAKRCSTRWGRSSLSHRETPGGSVDRTISS